MINFYIDELDLSTAFFMDANDVNDDIMDANDVMDANDANYVNDDEHVHTVEPSRPLYEGAPVAITEYMANRLLFQYSVKHSLTQKALEELLHLIAVVLPADAVLPKSVAHLKKFFLRIHAEKPIMQKYCTTCDQLYKHEEKQCECECVYSQFVTVPIGQQLKARLEGN